MTTESRYAKRMTERDQVFLVSAFVLGWATATVQGLHGGEWLIAGTVGPAVGAIVGGAIRVMVTRRASVPRFMFWTTVLLTALSILAHVMNWLGQPAAPRLMA